MKLFFKSATYVLVIISAISLVLADHHQVETSMWGFTPDRNLVSDETNLPIEWDPETGKNIKWVTQLGSQTYAGPLVHGGKVFVGTNNQALYNPKLTGDRGVIAAFNESDGQFLWQSTHTKLTAGRVNDWPQQGICSTPYIEGDRLYYISNRCQVVCVDTEGFLDGENDGPYQDEQYKSPQDGDIIWKFDMMEELGNHPHNMTNASPVVYGDLLFINTGNGQDETHVNITSPQAPAIIALNKNDGRLVWEDNSVEDRILHGQWSTPAVGVIGGVAQVVSAQGDGWVRGYDALTGNKLWEFDTNSKEAVWPTTRNTLIATPVIYNDRVHIANGQELEHGEGSGHFYVIDATKRGDITDTGLVWHFDKIRRSVSTAAMHDGLLYIADFSGYFYCLDADTGHEYWMHDLFAAVWSSAMVVDGKVYIGDEDGDVTVFAAGKNKRILAEVNMGSPVYGTVVPANSTLFLNNRNELYALASSSSLK